MNDCMYKLFYLNGIKYMCSHQTGMGNTILALQNTEICLQSDNFGSAQGVEKQDIDLYVIIIKFPVNARITPRKLSEVVSEPFLLFSDTQSNLFETNQ